MDGTSPIDDTAPVVAAWRELLASYAAVSCALERELSEKHGLGLSEFEVLDLMAESFNECPSRAKPGHAVAGGSPGKEKFRVQELAERVHLSQSALSRLIARLERDGLVGRALCDYDRRGVYVQITEQGLQRHAEAAPTHRAVLATHLSRRR